MSNWIKWLRLQEICQEVILKKTGEILELAIHASTTALPQHLRSAVERKGKDISIFINLEWNKNLDQVIDSLGHEVAHITEGTEDCQTTKFRKAWRENRAEITKLYSSDRPSPIDRDKA